MPETAQPKGKAAPLVQETMMEGDVSMSTISSTIPFTEHIPQSRSNASKTKTNTVLLPVYSYKDYSPTPTTVYTQHEEEANEMVQALRG